MSLLSGILGFTHGLKPLGGLRLVIACCKSSIWCSALITALVCFMRTESRVFSSGLNLLIGSGVGNVVVLVAVVRKCTLFFGSSCFAVEERSFGVLSCFFFCCCERGIRCSDSVVEMLVSLLF